MTDSYTNDLDTFGIILQRFSSHPYIEIVWILEAVPAQAGN